MRYGFTALSATAAFVFSAASVFAVDVPDGRKVEPAAEVDRLLAEEVFAASPSVELAPPTGDEVFLRRVYLDLVGENPSPAEVTAFVFDPSPKKRAAIVDRLLDDPRYGRNWGRYWRDVVLARRVMAEQTNLVSGTLEKYLTDKLNQNVGWNEIVRAFVTAKGNTAENGETALFVAQMAEPVNVASEASRIFLGIQIQCAQCHDHPTDRWKRRQFHELTAFFPRVGLQRAGGGVPAIAVQSFDNGPMSRRPGMFGTGAREHFMPDLKDPSAQGEQMTPVFFLGEQKLAAGVTDEERRSTLADWMTAADNPWFAKALVNRMWAELVGEGFYEPIDDMGPDRICSAPETLEYLSREFVASGYDVKALFHTIMNTAAYQRETRPKRTIDEPPFTANVGYRLRADQVYDALVGVMGYDPDEAMLRSQAQTPNAAPRGPQGVRAQFNNLFGYDPSVPRDELTMSVPQALALMNSFFSARIASRQNGTVLATLAERFTDDDQLIGELYLLSFGREPNSEELQLCLDHLRSAATRNDGLDDILWSLVNSKEFIFRR